MKSSSQNLKTFLPPQPTRTYDPVGHCIYCGSVDELGDEHIIPYGLGGRLVLPQSSCRSCSALSSGFEGTCQRTMFGPLRMLCNLPSRRKKDRPSTLPLKVKKSPDDDWTEMQVAREDVPFLILLPHFLMPDLLSGYTTTGNRGAAADNFWIRGASASEGFFEHLDDLIAKLGVHAVYPVAEARVEEFCLMLAKIAHSFAVAEIGSGQFEPLLLDLLLKRDLLNRANFIGGLKYDEPPSQELHEISLDDHTCNRPDLVAVRIRFLSKLGTPTYYVVAGRRLES